MKQRDRDILDHIIRYCDRISGYINGLSDGWNSFESDQMCQDACCMCIAQIGELSGHLTDEFKKAHPDIPWREIKDTRNLYVHNYGGIDLTFVWNTMKKDLPELKLKCQNYLAEEQI